MRRDQTKKPNMQQFLSSASLPAMPDSAVQLLKLSDDWDDKDAGDYARPIEADAALATQVLRFVNSSYFGFRYEICSIRQAITLLGLPTIKNFVMWTAVFGLVVDPGRRGFSMKRFQCDAIRRGLLARAIAKRLDAEDPEEVFTGALLQDIAVPVIIKSLGEEYLDLIEASQGSDTRLSELEEARYGWTHGDLGGKLLEHWSLPAVLQRLLPCHSTPEKVLEAPAGLPDACSVAVSSLAAKVGEQGWPEVERFTSCWDQLQWHAAADVTDVLQEVDSEYAELADVLEVNVQGESLADQFANAVQGATA